MEAVKIDSVTGTAQKIEDLVAVERPLHIFLGKNLYATIFCTPTDLKELVLGHLLSEGLMKTVDEVQDVSFKEEGLCQVSLKPSVNVQSRLKLAVRLHRIIPSACGGPYRLEVLKSLKPVQSTALVKAETLQKCVNSLNRMAETFRKTGGVHAAAVFKADGTLSAFAEDVGRHNAVDKAIGKCAIEKMVFNECFLALSGRLSADIVLKAARVGIPIIASIAAPLDSGIEVARKANLTLVGFVRGKRMNVYNAPERILSS
ncbi:MAG: formate dehydrogenase accessory sulfurtransferase FdhD [Candidatus Bathyarchaeota archaeon]|nr:formate dehydrogenase accessory sulfurtransferase FdhD [Candidatus Bathyarchaeota archaeon]